MIRIYQREITEAEKHQLMPNVPGIWKRMESFILKWLFIFMLSFIPLLLAAEIFKLSLMENLPVIIGWIITTIVLTISFSWREEVYWRRSLLYQDLEKGLVDILECHPTRAIEIKEDENMGVGFYLEVEDKKTLFLKGDYLYNQTKGFPNTNFEIIRAPKSGVVIDLRIKGEYLPPFETRKPFTKTDYLEDRVPLDGDILEKAISSIE